MVRVTKMPSVPARARGQAQRHVQNAAACPPVRPTIFSVFSYSPAPDCCGLASLGRLDGHPLHTHSPSTCLYVLAPSRVARAAALRRALLASRVPVCVARCCPLTWQTRSQQTPGLAPAPPAVRDRGDPTHRRRESVRRARAARPVPGAPTD